MQRLQNIFKSENDKDNRHAKSRSRSMSLGVICGRINENELDMRHPDIEASTHSSSEGQRLRDNKAFSRNENSRKNSPLHSRSNSDVPIKGGRERGQDTRTATDPMTAKLQPIMRRLSHNAPNLLRKPMRARPRRSNTDGSAAALTGTGNGVLNAYLPTSPSGATHSRGLSAQAHHDPDLALSSKLGSGLAMTWPLEGINNDEIAMQNRNDHKHADPSFSSTDGPHRSAIYSELQPINYAEEEPAIPHFTRTVYPSWTKIVEVDGDHKSLAASIEFLPILSTEKPIPVPSSSSVSDVEPRRGRKRAYSDVATAKPREHFFSSLRGRSGRYAVPPAGAGDFIHPFQDDGSWANPLSIHGTAVGVHGHGYHEDQLFI